MSTNWSQRDTRRKTIPEFVEKARALRPVLRHRSVAPVSARYQGELLTPGELAGRGLGRGDTVVLDYGDHHVGFITLTLKEEGGPADAPAFLRLKMCENADELEEDSAQYDGWIGKGWLQEEWLHIDQLPAVLRLPRRYALRYLRLEVLDTSPNYRVLLAGAEIDAVTSAPERSVPPVATDDPLLRRVDAVSLHTLEECMQEVFEDGPKRDRRLWIGDLRLQALVNASTFRNFDLVKRCLYLFAGLVREDGAVGSCLYAEPRLQVDNIFLLDYSLFFVPVLLDYARASGDTECLRELAPTAHRQLELARQYLGPDGVMEEEGRYVCFIDWKDGLNKQAAMQGVWLYALRQGIDLCRLTEDKARGDLYREWYEQGSRAAREVLWDEERSLFASGRERQFSWASQIWMCLAGVPEQPQAAALLDRAARQDDLVGMTTPYLYHHYVQALLECGETRCAARALRRYWGGMIQRGADTFWELFDPEDPLASPYGSRMANSYCHAWSCTPAYLLRQYGELLREG